MRVHMHVCVHVCVYVYVPAQMRTVGLMVCMHHSLAAFACTVSGVQAARHLAVHFKVVTEVFGLFVVYLFYFVFSGSNFIILGCPGTLYVHPVGFELRDPPTSLPSGCWV